MKATLCNFIIKLIFQFQNQNFLTCNQQEKIKEKESMQKLANFFKKSADIISQQTVISIQNLTKDLQSKSSDVSNKQNFQNSTQKINHQGSYEDIDNIIPLTVDNISFNRPLQEIQLEESKFIQLESKISSAKQIKNTSLIKGALKSSMSNSRIKEIQNEKKRILQELKKLDGQIAQIKKDKEGSQSLQKSKFHKKAQISDDIQAKKQAQSLIKQLHLQKMKIQEKKKKMQQKQLEQKKKEEQQKKRQRQQLQKKLKEQKRQLIEKRMQQERKKREERRMVDKQANVLISQLKKQEQLEKQRQLIPGQILQVEQKKKLLEKKNIFNIVQIENHQKKYKQLRSKQKQLRRERSESIKVSHPVPKYGKNVWVQRIQEQETKRREDQKIKELSKKMQLQKRMKYGDVVKNIFMSKQKKRDESIQKPSKEHSQIGNQLTQKKPRTPDVNNRLPQIGRSDQKRQNQTDKKFKERHASNSILENKRSRIEPQPQQIRQKDPQQVQKLQRQKQRELQLRKQTKQRLKKLQNQSIDLPKPQKVKYQNYITKVRVKKSDPHQQWKRIMSNQKLSKQQKYKEMLNKATHMENQAKIKQDLRKNGDQDAVNLYIGSIQAKLALLERF